MLLGVTVTVVAAEAAGTRIIANKTAAVTM
jgi:hypothetical protein